MKSKFSIIALVAILAACGGNGTQTGNTDTTHKDSTAPATPAEAMPTDTSKSVKPDSQTKPAGKGAEEMGAGRNIKGG